jgi:hypothetical protein
MYYALYERNGPIWAVGESVEATRSEALEWTSDLSFLTLTRCTVQVYKVYQNYGGDIPYAVGAGGILYWDDNCLFNRQIYN